MHSPQSAAIGFRVHTGWAAMIAISGTPERFELCVRRRVELLPEDGSVARFVYHEAAELPLAKAEERIASARTAARECALRALAGVLRETKLTTAGIPAGSTQLPPDLPSILASHARIHAAEGQLFQSALREACEHFGLRIVTIRERSLVVDETLRARFGPPWAADQKFAMASALEALKAAAAGR